MRDVCVGGRHFGNGWQGNCARWSGTFGPNTYVITPLWKDLEEISSDLSLGAYYYYSDTVGNPKILTYVKGLNLLEPLGHFRMN